MIIDSNNDNNSNSCCSSSTNSNELLSNTNNSKSTSSSSSITNKFISTTSLSSLLKLNKNSTNSNNKQQTKMSNVNTINSTINANNANPATNNANKLNLQQQITNGLFIRKEIQRFESVHPNIYAVYDLIDSISDFNLQQQIREHIVNIEDSFVNSQEWTLSRSVPDLKLGILGSAASGKSSLVHRFLTGTYMQEESPEGGRFKKEVIIDGQSYLLLIRDEAGAPEMQFTHWVDAVIFVFSLENEESFLTTHQYYLKMCQYRNMTDVPFILVGTQDFISESQPRCIDDQRARSLANELKKCSYYETCATYGLHVERVFHDACQKVVNLRAQLLCAMANITSSTNQIKSSPILSPTNATNGNNNFYLANPHLLNAAALHSTNNNQPNSNSNGVFKEPFSIDNNKNNKNIIIQNGSNNTNNKFENGISNMNSNNLLNENGTSQQQLLITPVSTPNQKRKDQQSSSQTNRRRSNLFTPNKKEDKEKQKQLQQQQQLAQLQQHLNDNNNNMGIGRSIPIKQGFLYKKTNSTINKDWKKKFVTLNDDGSLKYYPSMNDYMEDSHGKEIDLQKTTIKIPGANKPRIGKMMLPAINLVDPNKLNNDINSLNLCGEMNGNSNKQIGQNEEPARIDVNSKKRHRRIKSNHKSDQNNPDEQEGGYEFLIVSLDNKQWTFEAASQEEREEWVQAIEQQILTSLQSNEPNKLKSKNGGFTVDSTTIQQLKSVPGNSNCVDCDAPNPVWASLNYGALICIECSGIHRNLGTHLSRVRSLELDDWSSELIQVMTSIGNKMINSIYEAQTPTKIKQTTPREEKEKYIRSKYEHKLYLAPLPNREILTVGKQLLDAVSRQDIHGVVLCLAHSKPDDVNSCVSQLDKRTALHIAAAQSNLVILQLLIWSGADVDLTDNQGRNALAYSKSSTECTQLLIHNGCKDIPANNISINNSNGTTTAGSFNNNIGPVVNNNTNVNGNTLTRKSNASISTSHLTNNNLNLYDKINTFNII